MESLRSQVISAQEEPAEIRELKAQKDEAILLLLAKLAVVYWRPDFTAGQAKQLYSQYLDDLRDFAFQDIADAIEKYRRDPENKFYPSPGQLRGLIAKPPSWWVNGQTEWSKEIRSDAEKEILAITNAKAKLLEAK